MSTVPHEADLRGVEGEAKEVSPLQHGVLFVGKDHDDAVMLYSIESEGGRKGGGLTYEYSVKEMRPIPAMILLCPYLPLYLSLSDTHSLCRWIGIRQSIDSSGPTTSMH